MCKKCYANHSVTGGAVLLGGLSRCLCTKADAAPPLLRAFSAQAPLCPALMVGSANGCPWTAWTRDTAAEELGYTDNLSNLVDIHGNPIQ